MSKLGIGLRVLAIIAVAGTAIFTILGGIGTACLAWNGQLYGKPFAWIVPAMPTYQNYVYASVFFGVVGVVVAYALLHGDRWAYWGAVVTTIGCAAVAAAHMATTSSLKGVAFLATPPTNMRLYVSVVTLIILLLLRIPGIWQFADFTRPWRGNTSGSASAGLAAIMVGVITVTTPIWAGESHMLDGFNLVYVLYFPLTVGGWSLILGGSGLLALAAAGRGLRELAADMRKRLVPVSGWSHAE